MGVYLAGSYNRSSLRPFGSSVARKVGRIRRRPATDGTALFTNRRRAVTFSPLARELAVLKRIYFAAGGCCSSSVGLPAPSAANPRGVACPAPDEAARHATPPTNGRR